MKHATLLAFGAAVVAGSALLWAAEVFFRGTAVSAIVLVAITVVALVTVRPGWHVRPRRLDGPVLLVFGILAASAAAGATFLHFVPIEHPYDMPAFDLIGALPALAAITALEELLFRHAMYRWLESRSGSSRTPVLASALAFGWAHLGLVLIGESAYTAFHILQSLYLVWIGLLLGEIRRLTASWPMSWLGHFGYNLIVLVGLDASE